MKQICSADKIHYAPLIKLNLRVPGSAFGTPLAEKSKSRANQQS